MRRTPSLPLLAVVLAGLAACDSTGPDAPGGVSAGEAEALEDAAEMLDQRRLRPGALPPEAAPAEMTGDTAARTRQ